MLVSGAAPESIFIIAGVGRTRRVLSELLRNSRIFLLTKTSFGALSATCGCYRVSLRKLAELYVNTHPF